MKTFEFTVVFDHCMELNEELCERLFAARCDDGTPGTCCWVTVIDFHREAASLEEAIRTAVANVSSAGCVVARVEIDAECLAAGG